MMNGDQLLDLAQPVISILESKDPNYPRQIPQQELELLSTIGEGGFCDVWEGRWHGAPVAIKRLILPNDEESKKLKASEFLNEIKLHSSLNFPLIIPVMGMCIQDPKEMFLIMEQAPLGSLFGLLHVHNHRSAPIEMPMSLRICLVSDCASAVSYLHSRAIVHRDIKSMNFLVFPGWRIKLCDFGLSVPQIQCEEPFSKRNGTYAWLAPECIVECRYSLASDVYALSMLGYELLNRKPPFDGMSDEAIAQVVEADERPSFDLEGKDEEVPTVLQTLLGNGWSREVMERPSAHLMVKVFTKCVDERYGGDPRNDQLLSLLNIDFMDSTTLSGLATMNPNEHSTMGHKDRQTTSNESNGMSSSSSGNTSSMTSNGGNGNGVRWDEGLDVAQLRLAFLEMAESGVIFERSKELSLHLSRTQNKPFVHDSEANQSIFLDEEGVSAEIVMEANGIMHKLIRHYARKQRKAMVIADSRNNSNGTTTHGRLSLASSSQNGTQGEASGGGGHEQASDLYSPNSSPKSAEDQSYGGSQGSPQHIGSASDERTVKTPLPKQVRGKVKPMRGRGITPRKGSGPRMV